MKHLLLVLYFFAANLSIAQDVVLDVEFFRNIGYNIKSDSIRSATEWEKENNQLIEKRIIKIKSTEQVTAEEIPDIGPDWYYRFEVIIESYPDNDLAISRLPNIKEENPDIKFAYLRKSLPLREGFVDGSSVYILATDVSIFYDVALDEVLNKIKTYINQNDS